MTRRNPVPSQMSFVPLLPTWAQVKLGLAKLPEGWRQDLALYLGIKPSAVTMLMVREGQPSYQRVCTILQFLSDRGVSFESLLELKLEANA